MLEKVLVASGGVLGSQIALQNAVHGKTVTIYDISAEALAGAKKHIAAFKEQLIKDTGKDANEVQQQVDAIKYEADLAAAVKGVDLVIEAVPESFEIKKDIWTKLSAAADAQTIFVTNTSTMLPSKIAAVVDRPAKFIAMHFANLVWAHNTAEIMAHAGTDPELPAQIHDFAKSIGLVPIMIKKEHASYLLNNMFNPFLTDGLSLWYNGIADYQTIDKVWMIDLESQAGPFGLIDIVGLRTMINVLKATGAEEDAKIAEKLQTEFVDQGKTGAVGGEGFYKYPQPAFLDPDFLKVD
ncbi:3-hydroxyacyl-CoA dehydrogenase [Periweissella fabaria]|uniref:3-hydroxybutyryl-CoA dehydrogenase n=1 Tax=Periweissella fabaria TaxID=546157 RepID=A0ABM8Z749_9LACO|nr:3-hydroxyacyl-CoA dehydrogenase [Periweissella fabaria]MCM0597782.1 3-hydroxyacyl-CoA dehydrogenase [Periweissella fabaria]CAH0417231.1 putative 3-hydroxybutyryl-CoA dehydrogenase [Periweissella fabaria]